VAELWQHLLDGMGSVLALFYAVVPSYGVAIIGLTVAVRLLLFPLTAKQARSLQKMQLVQPEIKRLQQQYKDDRQKLNEEIMKFYKENQVNPLAGCLPLVAQMPVFFALFAVLRHPVQHIATDTNLYHAFCGAVAKAACKPKGLSFLGMNLSKSAAEVTGGFGHALPYFVLIALVVVTGYLQFQQTQSRQAAKGQAQNPQAAMMGKIFPLMFAFISYRLPSGVVVYFFVSNAWQIGQQALIFGSLTPGGAGVATPPAGPVKGATGPTGGGGARNPSRPKPGGGEAKGNGDGVPGASGETPTEGRWRRALGAVRGPARAEGATPPPPPPPPPKSRAPGSAESRDGLGRAQPSGSKPRPRKRRR
jgi:YidC/Oxa1 family membrane protein insertase